MQNLPKKLKPCSGPLIKIIILLSECMASSLTTSLKSINENVWWVFQQPFTCMNEPKRKQIYIQTNYFSMYFSWGYNTSFYKTYNLLPYYKVFKTFESCSVCSPKTDMCRNKLFVCRFACSRGHSCMQRK